MGGSSLGSKSVFPWASFSRLVDTYASLQVPDSLSHHLPQLLITHFQAFFALTFEGLWVSDSPSEGECHKPLLMRIWSRLTESIALQDRYLTWGVGSQGSAGAEERAHRQQWNMHFTTTRPVQDKASPRDLYRIKPAWIPAQMKGRCASKALPLLLS